MKRLAITLFITTLALGLFAQSLEVPKDYKLKNAEDYEQYEDNIVECVNWLIKTPITKKTATRKNANKFVLEWISGSPKVLVEIQPKIVNFMGSYPDYLLIFMGGWAKYSIENDEYKDKVAGSLAGIEAVIEFYKNNKDDLKKEKHIEKYIKMQQKGTLKDYIKKHA